MSLRKLFALASSNASRTPSVIQRGKANIFRDDRESRSEISIMSYNVLCDKFCTTSRFPSIAPEFLTQGHRFSCFQKEIIDFGAPDILCLQESNLVDWPDLSAFLSSIGYEGGIHQSKKLHEVPLAVYWKKSKLSAIWYEERSRAMLCEFQISCHDTKEHLFVINVHLEGNPSKSSTRVRQLRHALQRLTHRLDSIGIQEKCARVIVAGDFNSTRDDSPCIFLQDGCISAGEDVAAQGPVDTITHPFNFFEMYSKYRMDSGFTHMRNGVGSRLDFIWCTENIQVEALFESVPFGKSNEIRRNGIPNAFLPSDHLPVGGLILL